MWMKRFILLFIFLLNLTIIYSQDSQRISINGVILSENQDVEGVTVFNSSSNTGTITNKEGEFILEVALNDRIEVSALQFNSISLTVNEEVMKSKQIKIYLVEHINQLDAVLLSTGLIGNMALDIDNVKMLKEIELNMGNKNMAYEYNDDKAFDSRVTANNLNVLMNKGQFYNGVDLVAITGGIYSLLVKPKSSNIEIKSTSLNTNSQNITNIFSHKTISQNFKIPQEKVLDFLAFLEPIEINQELFKLENQLQLIDFLETQSKLYLKENDIKN